MKVLKFGGSSVANADNIGRVIEIVRNQYTAAETTVVVVSALGGVTDALIELTHFAAAGGDYAEKLSALHEQHHAVITRLIPQAQHSEAADSLQMLLGELDNLLQGLQLLHLPPPSPRVLDQTMSFGERLSAFIVGEALRAVGLPTVTMDARQLIRTNDHYGTASVDFRQTEELLQTAFQNKQGLAVLGGFIAGSAKGNTTTLGRGGSDYTAAIVGAALACQEIQIWTDVDGVLTADPRKISAAFPLEEISYEEAGELAHFGAKVIHPKTMLPARAKNIPIRIKNTFRPEAQGTLIQQHPAEQNRLIAGISALDKICLLSIKSNTLPIAEVASLLFQALSQSDIEVILTTQASAEQSISIAVPAMARERTRQVLQNRLALQLKAEQIFPIDIEDNLAIVALVGRQMRGVPNISGRMFSTLGQHQINVRAIAQGSSELNISAVIRSEDQDDAVRALHQAFVESAPSTVSLFLVGTGQIGAEFLAQFAALRPHGEKAIRVCGLLTSRRMVLDPNGMDPSEWRTLLERGEASDLNQFVAMVQLVPKAIVVDCSASGVIADRYPELLTDSIAVVAANKQANSRSQSSYNALKQTAGALAGRYRYETNVGAGLPILSTLQDLLATGDEIMQIEGVLSGTLSYIFNTFAASDLPFSQIVREAKSLGYTEPDPRDDLSGLDVARKLLILARETGAQLELEDITLPALLPDHLLKAPSVEEFLSALETVDPDWETKRTALRASSEKMLPIARYTPEGGGELTLTAITASHPFYGLGGSDNIFAFTTKRYHSQPLVIRGPGAGAAVTAAGVLADVLKVVNSL